MGILDDAIREHLELKRQHGADESEVDGLEAEAFGPGDRPDQTEPPAAPPQGTPPAFESEAATQIISPGSGLTSPAGEGDQLDKVFEAKREEEAAAEIKEAEPTPTPAPEPPAAPEPPPAPEPEHAESRAGEEPKDAGDALELERQHLASQPTEHYDVDAAIAEEDENDLLSESRLSDELDRALETPEDELAAAAPEAEYEQENPEPAELDVESEPEPELEVEPDFSDDSDFFDQDDPLEGTPDFLEETPEHDRLWFEQKEPQDFDFGD